jgi:hypothetical protein
MTAVERPAPPPVRTHKEDRRWVGKSIRKVEDPKFLRGRGGYIADLVRPGTLHAAVLRSPMPHARIVSIDTSAAEAAGHRGAGRGAHRPPARLRPRPDQAHVALPGRGEGALRR